MATFLIKRLKPSLQEKFKWTPIGSGAISLKPNDYMDDGQIEATTPYAAWSQLRGTDQDLRVGDVLQAEQGSVHVCRYSGFEEATWMEPQDLRRNAAESLETPATESGHVA